MTNITNTNINKNTNTGIKMIHHKSQFKLDTVKSTIKLFEFEWSNSLTLLQLDAFFKMIFDVWIDVLQLFDCVTSVIVCWWFAEAKMFFKSFSLNSTCTSIPLLIDVLIQPFTTSRAPWDVELVVDVNVRLVMLSRFPSTTVLPPMVNDGAVMVELLVQTPLIQRNSWLGAWEAHVEGVGRPVGVSEVGRKIGTEDGMDIGKGMGEEIGVWVIGGSGSSMTSEYTQLLHKVGQLVLYIEAARAVWPDTSQVLEFRLESFVENHAPLQIANSLFDKSLYQSLGWTPMNIKTKVMIVQLVKLGVSEGWNCSS